MALIYTASEDGKLRRVSRDGGRAKEISDGEGGNASPCVAPDGSFVAYLVDRGDVDEQVFIAVRDLDAKTPDDAPPHPGGHLREQPASLAGWHARRLCDHGYLWPLESRCADRRRRNRDRAHHRADADGRCREQFAPVGPRTAQQIAFVSDRSGFANVWIDPGGGRRAATAAPDTFEQAEPRWSPDGNRIAYTRNEHADIQIMVTEIASGKTEKASRRRGVHSGLSWSADGERIYALHQSPDARRMLSSMASGTAAPISLMEGAPGGLTDPSAFIYPEHVSWQSSDGTEIYGLLLEPRAHRAEQTPRADPHPRRPDRRSTMMQWDPISQYWLSRGWAVLKPNFRGSTGYGRTYTDMLHGTWTDLDLQDNVTSINVLRERHLVDERRIVAWGGSGGGLATFACMAMAPGTFAAGVALYGVSDYVNFRHQTDRLARYLFDAELGPIEENYDLWVERSPVTHAARTERPLLVLQGDADRRVPPAQSEAMVEALKKAGKTVEYHVYPGEGHGWRRPRRSAITSRGWKRSSRATSSTAKGGATMTDEHESGAADHPGRHARYRNGARPR